VLARRTDHRIAKVLGREPLQLVVEGKGMHEDGACDVGSVGGQTAMVFVVKLLCECPLALLTSYIAANSWNVHGLAQPRDELLPHGFISGVDVMEVDRGCVGRF